MVKNMALQCEIKLQLYRALPNRDMKEALQLTPGEY